MLVQTADRPFLESIRSVPRAAVFPLFLIIVLYTALLLPTIGRQGISWDEQTDILIARAYIAGPAGWFIGSNLGPSQTWLPMFTVALLYALTGTDNLLTARLLSAFVSALTIVGVYVFCAREAEMMCSGNHTTWLGWRRIITKCFRCSERSASRWPAYGIERIA